MPYVPSDSGSPSAASRPMVIALFVSTCLLSIVSWYTTQQGMALYLAPWFAFLASLGVQSALVLVAWLIGFTPARRGLLIAVYAMTAVVSVGFSYVSLYTWFSEKERPALVERHLYDTIQDSSGKASQLVSNAVAEAQKHVVALDEMTAAEKTHGYIARAQDADPYLAGVREAVAREASSLGGAFKEGAGDGPRYSAFDRYTKLARRSLEQLQSSQRALADFRAQLKPLDPSEQQIRKYREVYDAIPWTDVETQTHMARIERPSVPTLNDNLDRTATNQEDMLLAFTELFTAPTGRHLFAFLLAAFIDLIVFFLAFASGPYFHGSPEQRWYAGSAAVDGSDNQVFVRDLLRKLEPGPGGLPRVDVSTLTAGERQLCLLLAAKGAASLNEEDGKQYYLLAEHIHEQLVESLSTRGMPLRGSPKVAQAL
ncbi:hypothetical protein [uncultured Paludibaculum sp.]|uniref:hypothetical protein n=1 Tax=uncultured Paludibaculum sp. TaxID=1765020 RepID=UPI002AAB54DC|nr:hypothetical protein [uncultured Paludibaculum sp.]